MAAGNGKKRRAVADLLPSAAAGLMVMIDGSRVDIAINLTGVSLQDILVFSDMSVRSSKYDRQGKLETVYLGNPKSQAQTRVYDKGAEMSANGMAGTTAAPITRLERAVRNAGLLKNLHKRKDPFALVHIAEMVTPPPSIPLHRWKMFCAYAREHTPQAALAILPKEERAPFKKAIKSVEPIWWNTGEIWKGWPSLIDSFGFLPSTKGLAIPPLCHVGSAKK